MSAGRETVSAIPVILLKEGTSRTRGKEALRLNIMVAKTISEALKSTLSPKGMQKMLVDPFGDVVITHDGATIMKEMEVEHPTAKMMVDLAKAQEQEVGDGTTTVVILAGELLSKAQELLDLGIHPTIILEAYRKAAKYAIDVLESKLAEKVQWNDKELLKKVAKIAMGSKLIAAAKDYLAEIVTDAVLSVYEERDGKRVVDLDNIKLEKKEGGSIFDTKLTRGLVIDKEVVHPDMPKLIKDAKIALIESALEIKKPEISSKIRVVSPTQVNEFLEQEKAMLKEMVDKIAEAGANVVFCQKGIDDVAQHFLAKRGIMAVRRVRKSDIEKLAKATGASIVVNIKDISPADLGYAGLVEERRVGEDKMVFVENCKDPKAVSILIRGGSKQVIDEAERSLHDALSVVRDVVEDGYVVPGGGAVHVSLALELDKYAKQLGGKEQIVVEKFAEALESIPRALIENSGEDPITMMAELKKAHVEGRNKYGFDVLKRKVDNMFENDIIEPLRVHKYAIRSAAEFATTVLKVDDIIAAAGKVGGKKPESKGEEGSEFGD
ncbi:thermosome subunit beta [Candidatus Methanodesulfokora washburnensis]|jgi:thermosome|uniref:Thermosome subunit n=1 Tax=Candidatus Methanodesulfokora washburnensis TaxID=2478471 RepID=A0A3R9PG99_9CREN|nr:thermosome subunit beta [Candidatus Methanodesulfokores washburnensis]RSN72614.1 thermosome subunit [Candidatus Methanodesulfokores washburnensis]